MRIYKIYAQCCTAAEPIKEIDMEKAKDLIKEEISSMVFNEIIHIPGDTDDEVNKQLNPKELICMVV